MRKKKVSKKSNSRKNYLKKIFSLLILISLFFSACTTSSSDSGSSALPPADRTIMFYIIGSDLEEGSMSATQVIASISEIKNPENLNLVIMTGGALNEKIANVRKEPSYIEAYGKYFNINWEKNQIWQVRDGLKAVEEDFGNEDMTDGKTLEKFLNYVKRHFPAKTYDIIFSDHGGAGLYSFGVDTRYSEEGECLSLKKLEETFKNTNMRFSTVGFDACLMASFELMSVLEPYSDYLIAAEETSFGGWDYSFLNEVSYDVNLDPVTYGKIVVDRFIDLSVVNANSLGLYSLKGFNEAIDESLTSFSANMNKYLTEDNYLIDLYDILNNTMGLGYITIDDVRDLKDFLDWIENLEDSEMPEELKNSARKLWEKVEPFVLYYRTRKQKNEDGSERTGGINFVFPVENVYYSDGEEYDNAILSMKNYPESLNEDYRTMFKLAFLRKSLVRELKYNAYEKDDREVEKSLNAICDRAYEKYKLPKAYVDKIKNNIVPMLSGNRLKACEDGNIDFQKEILGNKVTFDFIYDTNIAWMIFNPIVTARTYDYDGKELNLGTAIVHPDEEKEEGDKVIWKINPKEDRWFTISSGGFEYLASFIVNDDYENDTANVDYLFNTTVDGFVPAILRRYENDYDDDNIIQIHVRFDGNEDTGKIVGFTRYDQVANMSAKDMEYFKDGDKVVLIANFDDFYVTKNISYIYYNELPIEDFTVYRGTLQFQSVYFKYSAKDIYGENYDFDVDNQFAFELGDADDTCLYATLPSTWTDVVIDSSDGSFESTSDLGEHEEKIKVNLYDVTNNANIVAWDENSNSTVEYLMKDDAFSLITDYNIGWIGGSDDKYIPMLTVFGKDKRKNDLSKKYVYFEMDDKKYLIELSSIISDPYGKNESFHEMRLVRMATELMHNIYPDDDYTIKQKIATK